MIKIESKIVEIAKSDKEIFDFLADFTHFSVLLPEKVENWKATKENCSFTIKGLTDFGMKIESLNPYSSITITNDEQVQMPVKFTFRWKLDAKASFVNIQACFDLDINPMMAMMVKKPLQEFVNILVEKLKEKMEL